VRDQRFLVLGDHAEGERAVAGDVLAAAHLRRNLARIAALEEIERETLGAAGRRAPGELLVHGLPELLDLAGIARERVQARLDAVHAVHEEAEVDRRLPGNCVPRHRPPRHIQLDARHHAREHAVEALGQD
jgi:hypothetical protein